MIKVKIFGGIGNQMFQYAFGKAVALQNNYEVEYVYDSNYDRELGLKYFNIRADIKNKRWMRPFFYKLFAIANHYTGYRLIPYYKQKYIYDYKYIFDQTLLHVKDGIFLEGYWQSEKYFKTIESIIREDFKINDEIINKKCVNTIDLIKAEESVSIHFRRGDYISDENAMKIHGLCGNEYYRKAIAYIKTKILDPHFYVFSDDINWVKDNFKFRDRVTFIDFTKTPVEDLLLMSSCKHNIVANSTFSWWGAWLNTNHNKVVIAPKQWFKNNRDASDLLIDKWIKIDEEV